MTKRRLDSLATHETVPVDDVGYARTRAFATPADLDVDAFELASLRVTLAQE